MEDFDISKVDIILIRHAEAISNIRLEAEGVNGVIASLTDIKSLAEIALDSSRPGPMVKSGVYLPDGLTQYGVDATTKFVKAVGRGGMRKLENVYRLVSSPLTRSIQTLEKIADAFQLVGPLHAQNSCNRKIYCHPGIREATNWPQDLPPLVDGRRIASYIKIAGGFGSNAGIVLGEEHVDFSAVVLPDCMGDENVTLQARISTLMAYPSLESIEERVKEFRIWLRECAVEALEIHQREKRQGTPRVVVCLHGGIINFLTQNWYCDFKRDTDSGEWVWSGSGALGHLQANVYKFESLMDDEAKLKESPYNNYYARILGNYYRHMAGDDGLLYKNPNGTFIDQKYEHWRFIERVGKEVKTSVIRREKVMEILLKWQGAQNFLAEFIAQNEAELV
jgi:broad specificity phosphatase PhoE